MRSNVITRSTLEAIMTFSLVMVMNKRYFNSITKVNDDKKQKGLSLIIFSYKLSYPHIKNLFVIFKIDSLNTTKTSNISIVNLKKKIFLNLNFIWSSQNFQPIILWNAFHHFQ